MNKRGYNQKIKLTTIGDMLQSSEDTIATEGQIVEILLENLHTFENHPFRVLDDEAMEEMVESIKQYGVLVPAIARPRSQGGYELLSGHRRHHASTIAGKETMPVIIKDCNDDEATMIMVDANIQREDVLISEKARAYRMKYDAMTPARRASRPPSSYGFVVGAPQSMKRATRSAGKPWTRRCAVMPSVSSLAMPAACIMSSRIILLLRQKALLLIPLAGP